MPVLKSRFTLRLDLTDHAKIIKIATAENRSMNNMIETLIKQKIKEAQRSYFYNRCAGHCSRSIGGLCV